MLKPLSEDANLYEAWLQVSRHMDWDTYKTFDWFNTRNPLIANMTPFEYHASRPQKFIRFINSLIDEAGGFEEKKEMR